jgi:hypothetical protein
MPGYGGDVRTSLGGGRAWSCSARADASQFSNSGGYTSREADDIANLSFVGGNRAISDKEPAKYLAKLVKENGTELFDSQAMQTDTPLLEISAYKQFLSERRKRIAVRLNEYLQQPKP